MSETFIKLILVSGDELSLATFGVTTDEEVWPELDPCGQESMATKTTSDVNVEETKESGTGSVFEVKNSSSDGVKESILKLAAHQSKAYETYMQGTLLFLKALENVQNRSNGS